MESNVQKPGKKENTMVIAENAEKLIRLVRMDRESDPIIVRFGENGNQRDRLFFFNERGNPQSGRKEGTTVVESSKLEPDVIVMDRAKVFNTTLGGDCVIGEEMEISDSSLKDIKLFGKNKIRGNLISRKRAPKIDTAKGAAAVPEVPLLQQRSQQDDWAV